MGAATIAVGILVLQTTTGLTKGNLSSHLAKLKAAGMVKIKKWFLHKKPNANVELPLRERTESGSRGRSWMCRAKYSV